ncbi:MAG: hypothetical protein J0M04_05270 [Verrucomicrobia bacterium]|nr:hypothetical protein [Verrucomicrobiota bacterium]
MDDETPHVSASDGFRCHCPEARWKETCRPRLPLPFVGICTVILALLVAAVGVPAGVLAVTIWNRGHPEPGTDHRKAGPAGDAPPFSAQSVVAAKSYIAFAFDQGMTSEAGWDASARMRAAAIRVDTEARLARRDIRLVMGLGRWREDLGRLQDLMVRVAEVATGGGTWAGHEMERNDLELEEQLLAPHGEALGGADGFDPGSPTAPLDGESSRSDTWNEVLQAMEKLAGRLREEDRPGDYWLSLLPDILADFRGVHKSMTESFAGIPDEDAALAVTCYLTGYLESLSCHFPELEESSGSSEAPDE